MSDGSSDIERDKYLEKTFEELIGKENRFLEANPRRSERCKKKVIGLMNEWANYATQGRGYWCSPRRRTAEHHILVFGRLLERKISYENLRSELTEEAGPRQRKDRKDLERIAEKYKIKNKFGDLFQP